MHLGCAPSRVCICDPEHERFHSGIQRWSPAFASAAFPTPIGSEALAVPSNDGLGFDDYQRIAPVCPHAGKGNPEETIPARQSRTFLVAFEHKELLAEREVLGGQVSDDVKAFAGVIEAVSNGFEHH